MAQQTSLKNKKYQTALFCYRQKNKGQPKSLPILGHLKWRRTIRHWVATFSEGEDRSCVHDPIAAVVKCNLCTLCRRHNISRKMLHFALPIYDGQTRPFCYIFLQPTTWCRIFQKNKAFLFFCWSIFICIDQ